MSTKKPTKKVYLADNLPALKKALAQVIEKSKTNYLLNRAFDGLKKHESALHEVVTELANSILRAPASHWCGYTGHLTFYTATGSVILFARIDYVTKPEVTVEYAITTHDGGHA